MFWSHLNEDGPTHIRSAGGLVVTAALADSRPPWAAD